MRSDQWSFTDAQNEGSVSKHLRMGGPRLGPVTPPRRDGGMVLVPIVFRGAENGDESALKIVDAVAARLARIIGVLATVIDLALVVLSGGHAGAGDLLATTTQKHLPAAMIDNPSAMAVSQLGSVAVVVGGISFGLKYLELHLLDGLGG